MNLLDQPDPPVNLDNVREMLGGDPARERELFGIFFESAEENIDGMEANTGAGKDEAWRTQAHSLKGMSLNLGANKLGELCATAQKNNTAPETEKQKMLAEVKAEYAKVKEYLNSQLAT
jgi:HPt (histidine-containing phosphotransfer) domain-containing protein